MYVSCNRTLIECASFYNYYAEMNSAVVPAVSVITVVLVVVFIIIFVVLLVIIR